MTRKTTPADVEVSPRDIHFDASPTNSGHWLDGDPVATAVFNALSLTFPDGERLFMDASSMIGITMVCVLAFVPPNVSVCVS